VKARIYLGDQLIAEADVRPIALDSGHKIPALADPVTVAFIEDPRQGAKPLFVHGRLETHA
jgi:hypothetical protein